MSFPHSDCFHSIASGLFLFASVLFIYRPKAHFLLLLLSLESAVPEAPALQQSLPERKATDLGELSIAQPALARQNSHSHGLTSSLQQPSLLRTLSYNAATVGL